MERNGLKRRRRNPEFKMRKETEGKDKIIS